VAVGAVSDLKRHAVWTLGNSNLFRQDSSQRALLSGLFSLSVYIHSRFMRQ
jgi:hypothetical protein